MAYSRRRTLVATLMLEILGSQTRGTFGVFYTLLGHDHFGAVAWK
jgi:hypothetical protein